MTITTPDPGPVPDDPDATDIPSSREPSPDTVVPGEDVRDLGEGAVGSIEPPD